MGEYIRKYDIATYSSGNIYNRYDVVKVANGHSEYYFVSAKDSNHANLDTSGYTSNSWWKRFDDYNNDFADIWEPTYSTSVDMEPKVLNSSLDDGATLLARDGINTSVLKFNLNFQDITDIEAKSLLCFADYMGANRSFFWTTPPPYGLRLSFSFSSLRHVFNKKNVNQVNMAIERSFTIFGIGAGQQKFGAF